MDESGRTLLTVALRALDRAAVAREVVEREGMVIQAGKGTRVHPLLAVIRDSENVALKAWRQLGLEGPGLVGRPAGKGPA